MYLSRGAQCRELETRSQDILNKVLQDNSYFAHSENIAISCLADTKEEVARQGVNFLLEARNYIDFLQHHRQFKPPEINKEAESYIELIDWSTEQKTEPPLTMKLTREQLLKALEEPLILPSYPCHTQDVERVVPVVTESCI